MSLRRQGRADVAALSFAGRGTCHGRTRPAARPLPELAGSSSVALMPKAGNLGWTPASVRVGGWGLPARWIGLEFEETAFGNGGEAEALVEGVGVSGGEQEAPERVDVGVFEKRLDHALGEAAASVIFVNKDIAEPGEGGAVGDEAGDADLFAGGGVEGADPQAVREGAFDDVAADVLAPVGAAEHRPDAIELEAGGVGGEGVVVGVRHGRR